MWVAPSNGLVLDRVRRRGELGRVFEVSWILLPLSAIECGCNVRPEASSYRRSDFSAKTDCDLEF